jgi:hypothetical protein
MLYSFLSWKKFALLLCILFSIFGTISCSKDKSPTATDDTDDDWDKGNATRYDLSTGEADIRIFSSAVITDPSGTFSPSIYIAPVYRPHNPSTSTKSRYLTVETNHCRSPSTKTG